VYALLFHLLTVILQQYPQSAGLEAVEDEPHDHPPPIGDVRRHAVQGSRIYDHRLAGAVGVAHHFLLQLCHVGAQEGL
jgi:hypothetical protein